jgi:hypothetical protein
MHSRYLPQLQNVQTLELTQKGIDADSLFESICTGVPHIRILSLLPRLARLGVSQCHFVGPALFSFFSF